MSSVDYRRRKAFVNAIVADTKLGYREEENAGAGFVDRGKIVMPLYRPEFTEEQNQNWMMQLLNNCYHNLSDNVGDIQEIVGQGIDLDKPFGQALAMVSKHNCHRKRDGMYAGADEYVDSAYEHDHLKFIQEQQDATLGDMKPELEAIKAFDMLSRAEWQLSSDYDVMNNMTEKGGEMLDKMLASPSLMADYQEGRDGGMPNIEMVKRLIEEATDKENAEQMAEEAGADGKPNEGEEGDGKGEGKGDVDGDGDGEGTPSSEGEGEGGEDGEERTEEAETQYRDLEETGKGLSPNENSANLKVKYKDSDLHTSKDFEPVDTKVVKPDLEEEAERDRYGVGRAQDIIKKMSFGLSTKIRNVLKVHSQARYQGGKPRGKINKRSIAKAVTGYDKIFRKKEIKDVLDTAVFVLVDTSGSMAGSKYTNAAAAAGMLTDCLTKLAVPNAVYGFSYTYAGNVMYQHKAFNQKMSADDMARSFTSDVINMSGNADAEAVLWAHDNLLKQKAKRKILIVLSDGSPAGPGRSDAAFLKHVTDDITKYSPIELYGIGIEDSNVERFYPNNRVLHNSKDLEEVLLSTVKSFMLK